MNEICALLDCNDSAFLEQSSELLSEQVDIAIRQQAPRRIEYVILEGRRVGEQV